MEIITKCPHCDKDIIITIVKHERAVLPTPSPVYEDIKCPECSGPMVSRTGKYGTFWGCKKFPECKGTRDSMGRSKAERLQEQGVDTDTTEYSQDTVPSERMSFNKKRWS